MIVEIGVVDDPERVGFYSGLIESIFACMSFIASKSSLGDWMQAIKLMLCSHALLVHIRSVWAQTRHSDWHFWSRRLPRAVWIQQNVLVHDRHEVYRWSIRRQLVVSDARFFRIWRWLMAQGESGR